MPDKTEVLKALNLGRIVAEQDNLLRACFVPNIALQELIADRVDIILGAKGSGKSAIWVELNQNQAKYPELKNVHIRVATNPRGDPEFRDVLAAIDKQNYPTEDDLRLAWRLYILGQVWNCIPEICSSSDAVQAIEEDIRTYGLIDRPNQLKLAFAFALAKASALKKVGISWKDGVQFEFDSIALQTGHSYVAVPFNEIFGRIDKVLQANNRRLWIILDRLDEIIIGSEELEALVLKGLLLAYRDVSDLLNVKVKIFIRDDVYDRVTRLGHFPALTHIRSRATQPLRWSLNDLLYLLVKRLIENAPIRQLIKVRELSGTVPDESRQIYYKLFPSLIDKGRAAEGFKWIVDRIKDGNGVSTPRDLLSVFERGRTTQLDKMERGISLPPESILFDPDTIRDAVRLVARENLETRVFAEYPDLREAILRFSGGKADHNEETLRETLRDFYTDDIVQRLKSIGFMYRRERKGMQVWTIPFFYSFALDVKRGFAFEADDMGEDEEE